MSIIVPAILPTSREEMESTLARLSPYPSVEEVQIDIVDGTFAEPASWPFATGDSWDLPHTDRFRYDLDLMITDPERSMDAWIKAGAHRITLHLESMTSITRTLELFRKATGHEAGFTPSMLSLGLAVNIDTDLSLLEPYLSQIDYVQCMGIAHIGRQGEPFDPRVLTKVRTLRRKNPGIVIQVDGGVSLHTAPQLLAVGVRRLVVGSALLTAKDFGAELRHFEALGENYGVFEK